MISLANLAFDLFDSGGRTPCRELLAAALGARSRRSREEDFYLGGWENDGADVSTFEHASSLPDRPLTLTAHEFLADLGVGRHSAHRPAHLGSADFDRGVDSVDHHSIEPDVEIDQPCGRRGGLGVVGITTRSQHGERDRPVHGPRVEVLETEMLGEGPGHGGLA